MTEKLFTMVRALHTKVSRDALKSFTTLTDMFKKFKPEDSKDALDFYFAYITALRNAGYKSLTINLNNSHITIVE